MSSRSIAHLRAKECGLEYVKPKVPYEKKTFMNLCYSAQLESSYVLAIISGCLAVAFPFIFALEHGDIFSSAE